MIHYTCDVCKSPLPATYVRPKQPSGDDLRGLCQVSDCCPRCQQIQKELRFHVSSILLREWRSRVAAADAEAPTPEPGSEAPPGPEPPERKPTEKVKYSGRFGREKQTIRQKLLDYREAHGLGCLGAVADKSGPNITDFLLRDMLIGAASPPIEDWRSIGKALDELTVPQEVAQTDG